MKLLILFLCMALFPVPADALELEPPDVPYQYRDRMPENTDDLLQGFQELLYDALNTLRPDLHEALRISTGMLSAALLVSLLQTVSSSGSHIGEMTGVVIISVILLKNTGAMIMLAAETVKQTCEYGKLLLPVMTTALAAQGGITTSGVLYAGTAFFTAILQGILDSILVSGVYLYLALSIGSAASGEKLLNRMGIMLKQFISWCLRVLLIIFTSYLSLTRVVSGTTDAAALKAAKVSMSSFIPVVGGILSDASEAVLVSAGLMKNAAGIYGILATLAVFLHPFLKIGLHYLILKLTGGITAVFGRAPMAAVLDAFSNAMALLLAMTGAGCLMILISTVCFMKGVL